MSQQNPVLKILYGVQATGQGHITRARVMAAALKKEGAAVDFVFTGRPPEELYGMEPFGAFQTRRGMTFYFDKGKVDNLKTVFNNNAFQLIKDIKDLDVTPYDLVITDYEPVTAWAAKLRGTPSIAIGHQYAFQHDIPMEGFNKLSLAGMTNFAPAQTEMGVHWHHFNQPILPPLFEPPAIKESVKNKIVVYLNFENLEDVSALVRDFHDYDFYIYSTAVKSSYDQGHLKFRPTSSQFKKDIEDCAGIICGAGFELATEALHMGKKILVKPMMGQPEQMSNALALTALGLGDEMHTLDKDIVSAWLQKPDGQKIIYPDVASAITKWIMRGQWNDFSNVSKTLWQQTKGLEHIRLT